MVSLRKVSIRISRPSYKYRDPNVSLSDPPRRPITYIWLNALVSAVTYMILNASIQAMKKLSFLLTLTFSITFLLAQGQILPITGHSNLNTDYQHDWAKSIADNSRSDTIDILKFTIDLDITDFTNQTLGGSTKVDFTPKMNNVNEILLDLLQFQVDSVTDMNGSLNYTYNDTTITVDLASTLNLGDTSWVRVHYQGHPQTDPSGFGGFYFTSTYAYNLGIAFQSQPHNYGRTWFPCFDNFVERAQFEFNILTSAGRNSWCNGEMTSEQQLGGDTLLRTWVMDATIPSYLASVAVSNYAAVRDTFMSISGNEIPVALIARPNDTTAMKNSFVNLHAAFDLFEAKFGAYKWNKVGYVLTPNGSMEHSTSIHYASVLSNGNLQYETTMAHELAHQWFGDLITCETPEEMWINEGWAEYLSFLFLEDIYGYEEYLETIQDNHKNMVHRVHILDEGHYALSDVPQDFTYGEHSYNKGADVLHTMRSYMGQLDFYDAWTQTLADFEFQHANSEQLRDHMQGLGYDVTDFFNDHILQPGWCSWEIDSVTTTPNNPFTDVTVFLQQKLKGADHFYQNVPLRVYIYDENFTAVHVQVIAVSGANDLATFQIAFADVGMIALNVGDEIGMALTGQNKMITDTGTELFNLAEFRLTVNSIMDSALVRVEQYWVAPDPIIFNDFSYQLSTDRYWRIDGLWFDGLDASARITYDGRETSSSYIDIELMQDNGGVLFHEDSLVLMYRPDQGSDWTQWPNININTLGSPTDKFGRIDFDGLQKGEYTLAWHKSSVGIEESERKNVLKVYPNPTTSIFTIELPEDLDLQNVELRLLDTSGKLITTPTPRNRIELDLSGNSAGVYLIELRSYGKLIETRSLILTDR